MKADIIVVGGGHAGIEAAYISSKKKLNVLLITGNLDTIGQMSCNPSIGGVSKGNLVREIDALGGLMAKIIDNTGIHFKMLNKSKGVAVWGNRAQANRNRYRQLAKAMLQKQKNISFLQGYVKRIECKGESVSNIVMDSGEKIYASAIILAMGTFLNGLIHIGLNSYSSGRLGELASTELTESLNELGIKSGRLKTGTSPRLDGRTIDYSKFQVQHGDENPWPFSFSTEHKIENKVTCFIGKTVKKTHEIILNNLDRSPLYTGKIKSIGPRYCPSIEDKIVRFGERDGHLLFLEPESEDYDEIYINGLSTSLPFDVQIEMVKSIEGLENAKILRPGYGIEYDFFPPTQLKSTLESKIVKNLYFAGQINGTSGYEEAGAQGIIAGINATQRVLGEEEITLGRDVAYIGVLIDDLVTRGTEEPYRMFTSRAEHRLILRQDNCDERLMPISYRLGFLEKEIYEKRLRVWEEKNRIKELLENEKILFEKDGKKERKKASELLKRPDITLDFIEENLGYKIVEDEKLRVSIEADIKYKGFEDKERKLLYLLNKMHSIKIPENIDYSKIECLLTETRKKLEKLRPETIGQASRIPGVTAADITGLAIYISNFYNNKNVSRETTESNL